jgi:hypothetical protein
LSSKAELAEPGGKFLNPVVIMTPPLLTLEIHLVFLELSLHSFTTGTIIFPSRIFVRVA